MCRMKPSTRPTSSRPAASRQGTPPDFAPGDISSDTARRYFDRGTQPSIDRNRSYLLSVILAAGLAGCVWIIAGLLPLKTVETFQVNKVEGGRLVVDGEPVGKWSPDSDSIAYFLNQWAKNVFDINTSTLDSTTAESGQMVVNAAVAQLADLRNRDNPYALLRKCAGLIRTYDYKTVNFVKDDVALLRFKTTTRCPNAAPKVDAYAMTVSFVRVKPSTREQVMRNPAGLYISNFNLTEESLSK